MIHFIGLYIEFYFEFYFENGRSVIETPMSSIHHFIISHPPTEPTIGDARNSFQEHGSIGD